MRKYKLHEDELLASELACIGAKCSRGAQVLHALPNEDCAGF